MNNQEKNISTRPTVVVLGCGPGGMFFLHAVEMRRRMMNQAGDIDALERLPLVTCYERSSVPGGVWNTKRSHIDNSETVIEKCTNMYEALWTNAPKELMEFSDYTFDKHFGMPTPTYLPRQVVLEYILSRVKSCNPNIFDDVKFNTTVICVSYDEDSSKFVVKSRNNITGELNTESFDKCIWAAGDNGKQRIPKALDRMLQKDFLGKIVHSSDVGDLKSNVQNKRILIIGDAYSAEDLALSAIKLGVEKVFINSRRENGAACEHESWPLEKVEIIDYMTPTTVIQGGNGIRLEEIEYDHDERCFDLVDEGETVDLENISTIIYCTGYEENFNMLDEPLQGIDEDEYEESTEDILPDDWKMRQSSLTKELGDVIPSEDLVFNLIYEGSIFTGFYNVLLSSQPNMMIMKEANEFPLLSLDICAWLCLAYVIGDVKIPSPEEMQIENENIIRKEMNTSNIRYSLDANYAKAIDNLGDDHWLNDMRDPRYADFCSEGHKYELELYSDYMKKAGYPFNFGTSDNLSEKGRQFFHICNFWSHYRINTPKGENGETLTFRDGDPSMLRSIHTGTKSIPLRKHWLELTEHDYDDLLEKK